MRKATVFGSKSERTVLFCGTRAVLYFECEVPVGESTLARHADAISKELLAHAERVYLPQAAAELEALAKKGRGFAFSVHRLRFRARALPEGEALCLQLSLRYTVGKDVRFSQSADSLWTADGRARCKRAARPKKRKNAVEK